MTRLTLQPLSGILWVMRQNGRVSPSYGRGNVSQLHNRCGTTPRTNAKRAYSVAGKDVAHVGTGLSSLTEVHHVRNGIRSVRP